MSRREVVLRVVVALAALCGTMVNAPTAIQAPLGLATLFNGGQLVARLLPDLDEIDEWLFTATAVAMMLILTGLIANFMPGGLSRITWGVIWAVVSLSALSAHLLRRTPHNARALTLRPAFAVSILGFAVLVAFAFILGTAGVRKQRDQLQLALSVTGVHNNAAKLMVESSVAGGQYEVTIWPDSRRRSTVTQYLRLAPRSHSLSFIQTLPPARRYWHVELRASGMRRSLRRELVLSATAQPIGLRGR